MSEFYINNIKATLVKCQSCGRDYYTPFYNERKDLDCKCGSKTSYVVHKENEKIKVFYRGIK